MAESAVVAYLRENGFLYAERRSLNGSKDKGDVTGTPGLCWEVKYAQSGIRMGSWIAQTEIERINSKSDHGILVIKPRGLGARSTGRWYAAMSVPGHAALLAQAFEHDQTFSTYLRPPIRYTAGVLAVELARLDHDPQIAKLGLVPALTLMPPGSMTEPGLQYRVMRLSAIVRTVRAAGYGDPLK